jgi:aminoglycoside phosphotransferase
MAAGPSRAVLGWVAGVLGPGQPEVVRGLRDGAPPWLLRAGGREVVLRVGSPAIRHELATEAAALQLATGAGLPVPELVGSDDGRAAGDLWQGNVLWQGTTVTGLLDWDCAGAGDPGVDLGSLRCDAAMCYGAQAPGHVLRGWQEQAGRSADRVAY